jgi:hypothetical protein
MANLSGQPKQFWKEVAVSYPCGTCGAAPGDNCTTTSGRQKYDIHTDRTAQASANDWQMPPS